MSRVPTVTGYLDPALPASYVNPLIASINTNTPGLPYAAFTAVGTGNDVTEDILQTFSLPGGTLSASGTAVRVRAWGTCSADANNKTMKLYFGAEVISTGAVANNNAAWELELIVVRGAAANAVVVMGRGVNNATPVATYSAAGTDNTANAVTIKCTGQNAVATTNGVVCAGMTVELLQ